MWSLCRQVRLLMTHRLLITTTFLHRFITEPTYKFRMRKLAFTTRKICKNTEAQIKHWGGKNAIKTYPNIITVDENQNATFNPHDIRKQNYRLPYCFHILNISMMQTFPTLVQLIRKYTWNFKFSCIFTHIHLVGLKSHNCNLWSLSDWNKSNVK
jgi:hypothetical protein